VTHVRTVLGDIDPSDLGVTYAHEHLVIDGGRPVELSPDFLLADVDLLAAELADAAGLGLRAVVDAMPADAGRNVAKLAELSRRTGVHVIAATGLHHDRYYGPSHWSARLTEVELADLFTADVVEGIDTHDYSGPLVRRTEHRAGIVKVAGSEGGPSARDTRIFTAAAETYRRTGVPILTHCEAGTGALEQVRLLERLGVPAERVVLSHVDKVVDPGYHRELLATGATAEYDQAFRWGDQPNGTLALLGAMIEAGLDDRIVLGMDAARQGYYRAYGGTPGLRYLLAEFSSAMAAHGIGVEVQRRLFIENPARVLSISRRPTEPSGADR
jgi:phosphotriesterase-related protein